MRHLSAPHDQTYTLLYLGVSVDGDEMRLIFVRILPFLVSPGESILVFLPGRSATKIQVYVIGSFCDHFLKDDAQL